MDILAGLSILANLAAAGALAIALRSEANALKLAAWLKSWAHHLQSVRLSRARHQERHRKIRDQFTAELAAKEARA